MIRSLVNGVSVAGLCAACCVPAMIAVPFAPVRATHVMGRLWARSSFKICGIEVEVRGLENIAPDVAYLVMATHTSHFDVLALLGWLPLKVRFVAKRELTKLPLLGWTLAMGAAFIVDRSNREQAIASIERARVSLDMRESVLFFPEGTRTPSGTLGELKKGPFYLATGARAPILPVGVVGTGEVLRKGDWQIRGGKVVLNIGAPIDTSGFPPDDSGRSACKEAVQRALTSLSTISA